ncbi:hypothetical protein MMPV_009145 [Pyropia vietnamensis]
MSTTVDDPPQFIPGDGVLYDVVAWSITVAQYSTCAVFLLFLAHKLLMLVVYPFITWRDPVPGRLPEDRPFVTVQLPCYNEAAVIRRVIDAACSMHWPRDRYEVHVLDDSNDQTTAIAEDAAAFWRASGTECRVIRRPVRTGYKAGALQWDIDQEVHPESRFFPVFDADFAPAPEWLETAMRYFFDESGGDLHGVSMVQGRWAHLNANANLLTRLQEVILNGHFWIEQVFRSRTGRPWNFNGTAGVWRRAAIAAVGGWEHDTIVEDSDLSIKCYDAGYRGVYVRDLSAPSELPVAIADYRSQQTRWIKGFGQLFAKKARGALTSPNTELVAKTEFLFHTLPSVCYAATVVFQLYFPLAVFVDVPFSWAWLGVNIGGLAIFWAFYTLTLVRSFGVVRGLIAQWRIPGVMVLCWGLAPLLAWAFVQGLFSHDATFTRTPKRAATVSMSTSTERGSASASMPSTEPSAGSSESTPPLAATPTTPRSASVSTAGATGTCRGEGTTPVSPPPPVRLARVAAATATAPAAGRGPSATGRSPRRTGSAASCAVPMRSPAALIGGAPSDGPAVSAPTGAQSGGGSSGSDADGSSTTISTGSDAFAAASAAAAASRAAAAKASYWTVKLSPLPLFEAAMAGWSAFAAIAAIFALAAAPLNDAWNTGRLWLAAVVVFCAGSAVGLAWNAAGALYGMAGGVAADVAAAAARRRSRRVAARSAHTGGEGDGSHRQSGDKDDGLGRRSRSEGDVPSGGESVHGGSEGRRADAHADTDVNADTDGESVAAAVAESRARASAAAAVAAAALAAVPPPRRSAARDRVTVWPLPSDVSIDSEQPFDGGPYVTPPSEHQGWLAGHLVRLGGTPPEPVQPGQLVAHDASGLPVPPPPASMREGLPALPSWPRPAGTAAAGDITVATSMEEDEEALFRTLSVAFAGGDGGSGGGEASPTPVSPWLPRPPAALRQRPPPLGRMPAAG